MTPNQDNNFEQELDTAFENSEVWPHIAKILKFKILSAHLSSLEEAVRLQEFETNLYKEIIDNLNNWIIKTKHNNLTKFAREHLSSQVYEKRIATLNKDQGEKS